MFAESFHMKNHCIIDVCFALADRYTMYGILCHMTIFIIKSIQEDIRDLICLHKLFAESSTSYLSYKIIHMYVYLTMPALQLLMQVKPVRYMICLGEL